MRVSSRIERVVVLGAIAVMLLGTTGSVVAEDWPVWRGPTHDGISVEKGWSPAALTAGKILWRASVGVGHATFAVAGGRVYTMGNTDNQDHVYCFDAETGEQIWKTSYDCRAGSYAGPRGTPTVDGDRVFTMSREGHLHCLEAATGKVVWMKQVASGQPKWGIATSPIVHGDLVVVNAGTSGVAYQKKSGKLVWSGGDGTPGYASPVAMGEGSGLGFLIFSAKALVFVNGKTGRTRWSHPWITKYDVNAADPVLVGKDEVFISSGYNTGCAMLKVGRSGVQVSWTNKKMRNHMASTIHHEGHLYGIDETDLACLNASTGAVKWKQSGFGKGAVMLVDGKLLIMAENGGDLAIAEATPEAYKELSRAKVLGGHTWTAPILSNGRIYCRNDKGDVVCVDVRGE